MSDTTAGLVNNPPKKEQPMPTVMPNGELLRRAVSWISEQRKCGDAKVSQLVEEASVRFNLSPLEQDNLLRLLKEECGDKGDGTSA